MKKQMFDLREWKKRERVEFKNTKSKVMCLENSINFCSVLDASRMRRLSATHNSWQRDRAKGKANVTLN